MAKPLSDYELSELQRDLALMGKDADTSARRNSWSSGPGRMRQTLRTMDQLLAPRVTSIADQASFVLERLVMGDDASVSSCEDDSQGDQADDSMELRLDLETPFDSLLSSKQALSIPIQPRPALLDAQTSCSSILSQSSRTLLDSLEKAAALDHPTLNAQISCGDLLSHNEAIGATQHNDPRAQTQSTRDEPSARINFSSPGSPITPGDIDLVPARRPARRYSADISEADRNLIMQGAATIAERRAWGEALSSAAAAAEKDKELIAFYANETKTLRERAHALSAQVLTLQKEKDHLTHERDELKAQVEFAQLQTRRRGSCGDIRTHNAVLKSTQEDSVAVARLEDELRAAKETARADRKMLEDALSAANHRVKGLEQRCKDLDKQVTQRPPNTNDNVEGLLLNLRQELRGMVSEAISESVAHEQQAMSRSSATPPDSPKSPRARNFSLSRISEQARLRMSLSRWRNTVPSSSPPPSPLQ